MLGVYFGDLDPEQSLFNKVGHFPGKDGFGEGLEWMNEPAPVGYGNSALHQALNTQMYG